MKASKLIEHLKKCIEEKDDQECVIVDENGTALDDVGGIIMDTSGVFIVCNDAQYDAFRDTDES